MFRFALLNLTITRLNPKRPIEGAILNGFADVLRRHLRFSVQINNQLAIRRATTGSCAAVVLVAASEVLGNHR